MTEQKVTDPRNLLASEVLQIAFKNDFGKEAHLIDFKINDFIKKGDNYRSLVTGVTCSGYLNGEKIYGKYVAKLNPLRYITVHNSLLNGMFIREATFFTEIAPQINKIAKSIDQLPINFPECVYVDFQMRREIMLTKDLRTKGFKMIDGKNGMGVDHAKLVIKELARLHAVSIVLKTNLNGKDVYELYPVLNDDWLDLGSTSRENYERFFRTCISNCIKMLDQMNGYENAQQWLQNLKNNVLSIYCDLSNSSPESMRVISHGDCWNNNFVFRHDAGGNPVEVALLDLQQCRFASLALDLNYFFYTTLTREVRKANFSQLLSLYYETFKALLESAGKEMPFTETEFLEEVRHKFLFGALSGFLLLPVIVSEENDTLDFDKIKDEEMQEQLDKFGNNNVKKINNNPMFRNRFVAIFDELIGSGIIK